MPQSPDRRIWIDGALVPWDEARVHVLAHSHARGSLIFDYLSVHETPKGPAIFRLREHVERLLRSAELVGLPLELGTPEIEAAVLETEKSWGPIEWLVNNGIYQGPATMAHVLDLEVADFERLYRGNVTAPVFLAQRVLPGMLALGRGGIVNLPERLEGDDDEDARGSADARRPGFFR